MAYTASTTFSINWTPPSAPANSGQSSFTTQASYNAHNVGAVDIPASTGPGTSIVIPFGTVTKPKMIVLKNLMTDEVELHVNGSVTNTFMIASQGMVIYCASIEVSVDDWTSINVVTTGTNTNIETLQYFIFGD